MGNKRIFFVVSIVLMSLPVFSQCRYCNSYEDFLNGRWQQMDTLFIDKHGKGGQFWLSCNDYTLTTGNKALDKIISKDAFIVMQADTMYLNCRNLRYENTRFAGGYTRAMRIGERSLLFVNRIIGRDALASRASAAVMFGLLGAAITAGNQSKRQVCYVISNGADEKGHIRIRLIEDGLMDQMIVGHDDLHDEYYTEEDTSRRLQASHVVPILEKAGLFNQAK